MSMDVSEQPGNSIETTEIILMITMLAMKTTETHQYHHAQSLHLFFHLDIEFIFVTLDTEPMDTKQKKRRNSSSASKFKKPKLSTDSDTDSESIFSVSQQIRASIAGWVRKQSIDQLKNLRE